MTKRAETGSERLLGSELADDPGFLFTRAGSVSRGLVTKRLAQFGLRVRHYSVLTLACSGQAPSQRELAQFLALDPGQIVALVDPLEERGLVERQPDPTDRRNKLIVATQSGRALQKQARAQVAEANDDILGALSPAERETLQALLRKIAF